MVQRRLFVRRWMTVRPSVEPGPMIATRSDWGKTYLGCCGFDIGIKIQVWLSFDIEKWIIPWSSKWIRPYSHFCSIQQFLNKTAKNRYPSRSWPVSGSTWSFSLKSRVQTLTKRCHFRVKNDKDWSVPPIRIAFNDRKCDKVWNDNLWSMTVLKLFNGHFWRIIGHFGKKRILKTSLFLLYKYQLGCPIQTCSMDQYICWF